MKRIYIYLFLFFVGSVSAQDFTHLTKKIAFDAGELFGNLEKCLAPPEVLVAYKESIATMKNKAFPDESYLPYIKIFDESFISGHQNILENSKIEKGRCEQYFKDADSLIKHNEKNT